MDLTELVITAVIALVTGSGATLLLTKWFEKREKRRDLFANAYKAVLSWEEMLNRVRRRFDDKDDAKKIVLEFHSLQQDLNYYEGLISAESSRMGDSYAKLVQDIKSKNLDLINDAWKSKPVNPGQAVKNINHPQTSDSKRLFLKDVRSWLSIIFIRKIAVVWRNRGAK